MKEKMKDLAKLCCCCCSTFSKSRWIFLLERASSALRRIFGDQWIENQVNPYRLESRRLFSTVYLMFSQNTCYDSTLKAFGLHEWVNTKQTGLKTHLEIEILIPSSYYLQWELLWQALNFTLSEFTRPRRSGLDSIMSLQRKFPLEKCFNKIFNQLSVSAFDATTNCFAFSLPSLIGTDSSDTWNDTIKISWMTGASKLQNSRHWELPHTFHVGEKKLFLRSIQIFAFK